MKFLQLVAICIALSSVSAEEAEVCISEKCQLADGCVCSSRTSPLSPAQTPQFITLTFDDSVTNLIYESYYTRLLFNRKNADGSPISATFYIPHSYTDYEKVNNLYNKGYDIAVNSISKGSAEYFKEATLEELIDEFDGQRRILAKFANISKEAIKGVRTPHLELGGNDTFEAYVKAGLEYDNSWVSLHNDRVFPYTLNYKSNQQCNIGRCPSKSFPNFWVNPIVNLAGWYERDCNVLFSCAVNGTVEETKNWLIEQYNNTKQTNKAPMSLLVNSAWFELEKSSLEGLEQFLDFLNTQNDTFVVSHKELVNWSKNPIELGAYRPVVNNQSAPCKPVTCPLTFGEFELRYMRSCVPCPNVYPWLKNPEGN